MTNLPYGYYLPQNPDTGDVFFPRVEDNFTRWASHNHDGANSAPLASTAADIIAASWVAAPIGGGVYRQVVTIPSPYTYDGSQMWFKRSSGEVVYPSIERISNSSFYFYTNDNTISYKVYYR